MIHIYTGEGKGKTTAAIGLAVRAATTLKVLFVQFMKDGSSSEVAGLSIIPNITYKSFGNGKFVKGLDPVQESKAKEALLYILTNAENFDVLILDESLTAMDANLISEKELLSLLQSIDGSKEVVLTGRGATENLIKEADLVTEMKPIKHYYDKGVAARKGIEY